VLVLLVLVIVMVLLLLLLVLVLRTEHCVLSLFSIICHHLDN